MIGFPLALNREHTGKVIAPAIITGSCLQLLGTSPDVAVDYVGPFLLPAGDLYASNSYVSYVNAGGSWIGTAELVDFSGNVIATATVSGAGSGFIQVPFDNNVNIPSDTLCYLRFTNTDSGAGVLTWYFEVVRTGALPFIVTPPTLTWTVAHGTSPVITDAVISGTGTLVYELKRGGTTVVSGTKATLEAYVSNRATDVGPSWRVTATITNGAGSATADSNTVAWTPVARLPTLRLALDAASGVTLSGADIDQWADQSGVGNDFEAPSRPLFVATGFNGGSQPYVESDGGTEYMRRSAFSWGAATVSAFTIIEISQNVTLVNGDYMWGYNGVSARPWAQQLTATNRETFDPRGTGAVIVNSGTSPRIRFSVYDNVNAFVRIGDTTSAPIATTGTHSDGASFCLFSRGDENVARASMRIAAFYVCREAINTAILDDMRAYAAWRWGV